MTNSSSPHEPNPEAGYEIRDTHVRNVVLGGLIIAVAVAIISFLMIPLHGGLQKYLEEKHADDSFMLEREVLSPSPQLEVHPHQERLRMQAEETRLMTTWGWADREKGLVRAPLTEALDRVLSREGSL